jgi:site-specific DNA recombinase
MVAKQTEVLRAAVYIRVSTEEQANEGYGLDVQTQRCRAQIIAKGWELAGEFADAGISGTKDASERPGLAALLLAAENSEIDAVVVLALDRLGRNTRLVLSLVETFADAGVEIVSCKESLDTSTPQGKFVLTMFAALAQLERDTIVERTTAGRNARGQVDGERGGRVPMGYRRTSQGVIEVDEYRAGIVKAMFALRDKQMSLKAIATYLNAVEIKTPRNKQWHASSVKEVIDNRETYLGGLRGASNISWPKIL